MIAITIRGHYLMATCLTCGSQLSEVTAFCTECGSLPQLHKHSNWKQSVAFGFGLLMFAVLWKLLLLAPSAQPARPMRQDATAIFLRDCGSPDLDKVEIRNGAQYRSLIYQRARIKAVFMRSDSAGQWSKGAVLDAKTLQLLQPEEVTRRLPCASPKL